MYWWHKSLAHNPLLILYEFFSYSCVNKNTNALKFNKIIANDTVAAVIWHGESETLYDTYNNKYVYIEVNEKGLVSSVIESTYLLLSASSLFGQKKMQTLKRNKLNQRHILLREFRYAITLINFSCYYGHDTL